MGELTFFLGLQVKQKEDGIFISQDKYVAEILKKFDFANVKTASTPIETQKPLVKDEEASDVDVHLYRVSSFDLESYSDSDYAGANLDRKSTTGGCQFLGRRLISWQCKKQTIVATSTTEAEYVAAASCCGQVLWIQNQISIHFALTAHYCQSCWQSVSIYEASSVVIFPFDDADGIGTLLIRIIFNASSANGVSDQDKEIKFPRKSFSKKHRVHKEYVSKQGRKFAKGESSVQRDPLFDEMPEDTIDHMETENAESAEDQVKGTDEHNEGTEDKNEGTDEIFEDQTEEEIDTQTSTQTPTSMIFGDDETIAKVLLNMSQAKAVSKEKEKAVKKFMQLESDKSWLVKIQEEQGLRQDRTSCWKKLQEQEREQFTIEERAKFLHDTIAAQRKFLAQQRSRRYME
ncbi:hypothetical protein Tco_0210255 [Tanacetum coccineum]